MTMICTWNYTALSAGINGSRLLAVVLVASLSASVSAQEPPPEPASLEKASREDSFSPYANRSFPSLALFGDTHVHSSISMMALMANYLYVFSQSNTMRLDVGERRAALTYKVTIFHPKNFVRTPSSAWHTSLA